MLPCARLPIPTRRENPRLPGQAATQGTIEGLGERMLIAGRKGFARMGPIHELTVRRNVGANDGRAHRKAFCRWQSERFRPAARDAEPSLRQVSQILWMYQRTKDGYVLTTAEPVEQLIQSDTPLNRFDATHNHSSSRSDGLRYPEPRSKSGLL